MAVVLRVAIVDPSDETRETLRNILLGVETVWLEAECSRYEYFLDVAEQSSPDVAIVTLDSDPERAIELLTAMRGSHSSVDVIAVSSNTSGQFILQVMQRGAKEFVLLPVSIEDMLGAIERIRQARGGDAKQVTSKVITLPGARGGVGCTSLAVNLGCVLAQDPENSVALVDLDLAMGDADVCLDVIPDYTLADVAQNIDRIDLQLLKRSLSKHSSGLYLLPHPVQIEESALIQHDHINRVLALLKMTFTHVIVDISKAYHPIDIAAMELSDEILLVTQLDVSNLRNVVRLMMLLNEREGMADKVKVVANRVGADEMEISISRAEDTIGRQIFCKIPNDSRTMSAARNSGVPLLEHAPRSKLFGAIQAMAHRIGANGEVVEQAPAKSTWNPFR